MRRHKSRSPIRLGIAGLGAVWELRYRDVISRLASRIKIAAVFDVVHNRACHVAATLGATPVQGVRSLFDRPDLQGVLVFDSTWLGTFPIELACEHQVPILLSSVPNDVTVLRELHGRSQAQGSLIMTECAHRHCPCSGRLKELIVTRLGSAIQIEIDCTSSSPLTNRISELVDWCQYMIQLAPTRVLAEQQGRDELLLKISYRTGILGSAVESTMRLKVDSKCAENEIVKRTVRCQRGIAVLESEQQINWQTADASQSETLLSERSEIDIVLDQFCRRIAGGLVPVPDLSDACRTSTVVMALRQSLAENREVEISSDM